MAQERLDSIALVVPEVRKTYWQRIHILQMIMRFGPIGRKSLAQKVGLTERPLRKETDVLRNSGLVETSTAGMTLTSLGEDVLGEALALQREGLPESQEEKKLGEILHLRDVTVVSGNLEDTPAIISEMAMHVTRYLDERLPQGEITVAITGGRTMRDIANHIDGDYLKEKRHFTVVSARGGLGDSADTQANTIASVLAEHLDATSHALYAPENVSEETCKSLSKEPSIQAILEQLAHVDAVLFSVGDAKTMAERRGLSDQVKDQLKADHAVGEAFGCFYDKDGHVVYQMPRIGLQLAQLEDISVPILVAGGTIKVEAVQAFAKLAPHQLVLITDEGISKMVLNGETL